MTKPFTAETTGDMLGTITFTPTSDVAGTLTYTGKVFNAPFKLSGSGKYTVNVPAGADTGTLDWKWSVTTLHPTREQDERWQGIHFHDAGDGLLNEKVSVDKGFSADWSVRPPL